MRYALAFLLALLLLGGCDAIGSLDFEEQVVVSALLIEGQPLPPIQLARTGPIDEPYDPVERSINDATVTVRLLAADGSTEATYVYQPTAGGIYVPEDTAAVQGGRAYALEAVVPDFAEPVTAETTVPSAFEVVRPPADTLVFQGPEQPSADVTPSLFPGRQAVYVFTIRAGEPSEENLTPFAAELVAERDVDLEDLVEGASPLLNEGNYDRNPDGTVRIQLPWFAVNFYGPTTLTVTALDDALVNFLQSQAIQFIPTTLSPGEIPNTVTNVENGLGVFGAVAQVQTQTFIARP
jgi:hypothetical protein